MFGIMQETLDFPKRQIRVGGKHIMSNEGLERYALRAGPARSIQTARGCELEVDLETIQLDRRSRASV